MAADVHIRPTALNDAPAPAAILREPGWFAAISAKSVEQIEARLRRYLTDVATAPGADVFVTQEPDGAVMASKQGD